MRRTPASTPPCSRAARVDAIFTDPPYNVPIDGHVSGLGETKHREFAFAAGEMSKEAFTAFLKTTLGHGSLHCRQSGRRTSRGEIALTSGTG